MRLQELFETTEEDRALISLSSSIYDKIITQLNKRPGNIRLGTIGKNFVTPMPALNNISIKVLDGADFEKESFDPDDATDYSGSNVFGFWDQDTNSIVLNRSLFNRHRMKTVISHELRHALDSIKSDNFKGGGYSYFTPRKREHREDDPKSIVQYKARPAEINARFIELLDILSKRMPKWLDRLEPHEVKKQLAKDFRNLLVKFDIADIFPEKTKSSDYKRLVKRAYDFMQKELEYLEKQTGKKVTGSWD